MSVAGWHSFEYVCCFELVGQTWRSFGSFDAGVDFVVGRSHKQDVWERAKHGRKYKRRWGTLREEVLGQSSGIGDRLS